ncbi:MAG TPA: glycosyltransferase family 2 protein [Micromonosporaceae bacterium]|nr:glycosyltransferase family 2 protein [Micromonosporaceae bacterium]
MTPVTVVIATRDRAEPLGGTLTRLRSLPDPPAIIVVDNGSRDGTAEVAERAGPDVRVIRLGRNLGAVARNVGVARARTPYVAFADDDSWWAADALPTAAELFDRHPRLGLIAARTLVGPADRLDPMCRFMASAPLGREPDLPGPSVLGFLACGTLVRREAFLAAGGFDPVVFFMGEEARLAYDLAAAGWGMAYCDAVVAHHHPATGGTPPFRKRALARRNALLTTWMRRPLRVAVGQTAPLVLRAHRELLARQVLADVARRLPMALRHRRPPSAAVEAAIATLEAAERVAGFQPLPAEPSPSR